MCFGRQDPHVPADGRTVIERALIEAHVRATVKLYDGEHAFMRDEGPRYDPEATDEAFADMIAFFRTALKTAF
jgi:carboxymethylenebutenolidase